jgi:hypothetical protein
LVAAGAIGTIVLAQQGNGRSPDGGSPAAIDATVVGAERRALNSGPSAPEQDERTNAEKAERMRLQHAASARAPTELKNARIRQKLDLVIDVVYPEGGNLEVLLKHIKKVTTDEKYPGIPIYVDPFGLSEVDKTMSTKVALDFKQQSIRSVLHYSLRPLGLSYDVRDGFLMISSRTGILENRVEDIDRKLDRVLEMLHRLEPAK